MTSDLTADAIEQFKDRVRRHCEQRCAGGRGNLAGSAQRPRAVAAADNRLVHNKLRPPRQHAGTGTDEINPMMFEGEFGVGDRGNRAALRPNLAAGPFSGIPHHPTTVPMLKVIPEQQNSAEVQLADKELRIDMDVTGYKPEELNVNIVGEHVVIRGTHAEEEQNANGESANISRHQFCRRYTLPEDSLAEEVSVFLAKNGVISVKVPRGRNARTPPAAEVGELIKQKQPATRKGKVKFHDEL